MLLMLLSKQEKMNLVAVEDDSEAPELFNDIKDENQRPLFPAAWAMYKKQC